MAERRMFERGLKLCPFCGCEAEAITVGNHIRNNYFVIKCLGCGASTKVFPDTDKGLKSAEIAWNRRVKKKGKNNV